MSTEMQTKVQASPVQNFTPVQTGLLQRQCTLCNTPGLVEDSGRDKEKLTLQRSSADQAGTTTVPPIVSRFGHDFSRLSVHSNGPGMIQTKLKINEPGDIYEQEADWVADAVMRMPEPGVQRQVEPEEEEERLQIKPLASQITPLVQRRVEEEEEEKKIQPKSNIGKATQVTPEIVHDIHSFKGTGQPLPTSERTFFEPRFGRDFSNVRVHTNERAAHASQLINAQAFTLGRDVVFGAGQFSPGTHSGRRLIAHELAHVVQQETSKNKTYIQCGKTGKGRLFVKNRYYQIEKGIVTLKGTIGAFASWYRIYQVKKEKDTIRLYIDLSALYGGDRFRILNKARARILGTKVLPSSNRFIALYRTKTSKEPINLKYLTKFLLGKAYYPQVVRIGITKRFVGYKEKAWKSLSSKAGIYANSWSTWTLRGLDEFLKIVSFQQIKRKKQINRILMALGNILWALTSFIPGISVTKTIIIGLTSLAGAITAVYASITPNKKESEIKTQIRRIHQGEIAKLQAKMQDKRLLGPILITVFVKALDQNLSVADRDALLWNHMFSIPYGKNRYNMMWKRAYNRLLYLYSRRQHKRRWIP